MFKVPISLDLPKAATWPYSSISLLSGRSEYILNYTCTQCYFVLSCKKCSDGFHDGSLHCQLWTRLSLQVSVSSSWKKVSQVNDHEFSNTWSEFCIFFLSDLSLTVPSVNTLISFSHTQSSHAVPIPLSDADDISPSPLYFLQVHFQCLKVHLKDTRLLRRNILLRPNVWAFLPLLLVWEAPNKVPVTQPASYLYLLLSTQEVPAGTEKRVVFPSSPSVTATEQRTLQRIDAM